MRSEGKALKEEKNQPLVSPHDTASANPTVLVKDFVAKSNVTMLKHPLLS
jgi:hypothetical protein